VRLLLAVLALAVLPTVASAQEQDYCPERPGLNTPPCVMAPGRVSVETSIADWTLDQSGSERSDTVLIGQTAVRIGLSERLEAQVGFTPFGHSRMRSPAPGGTDISAVDGIGDVRLGMKALLTDPGGNNPFAMAVLPYATLPVGHSSIGAGDWGAGVLLPISYSLGDKVGLALTPEADAAVDEDGDGRHLAFGSAAGLSYALAEALTVTGEVQALRDNDPGGHSTQAKAALSFAYLADANTQFDVFGAAGLNRATPDAEFYMGIAHRF
jgi:opacity protein-like surface antigen